MDLRALITAVCLLINYITDLVFRTEQKNRESEGFATLK